MYIKRPKGEEAEPAEEKSKDTPTAKVHHVRRGRPKGCRRDSQTGRSARGYEERDGQPWRSAQELGIVWLGAKCDVSPTQAHYLTGIHSADGGEVYCCKYCWKVKWLSDSKDGAEQMTSLMTKHGSDIGYQKLLDTKPDAKMLIYQLQDIWMLRGHLSKDDLQEVIDMSIKEDK